MTASRSAKTIYCAYMCDHGYVVAAALQAQGMQAESLAPPDDESLAVGLDLCRGRECLPCFLAVGDVIRRARRPDFDPARSALLIPSATGLCRFGQYAVLVRQILDEQGLGEVEIISPNASNAYHGFGEHPVALRRLIWQGAVAVDALQKLLHQSRPYERERGRSDEAYRASLDDVVSAVRTGGGKRVIEAMRRTAGRFEAVAVGRADPRPLIGLVGEIYLRFNTFSNQHIVRLVEAAGGEVTISSMIEWFYFTNWVYAGVSRSLGRYGDYIATVLSDRYQRYEERRVLGPVKHLLRDPYETPTGDLLANTRPHYEPLMGLETEAGLTLAKAVEMARQGASGIINVMPFGCMPGIVVAGMVTRFKPALRDVPWLDLSYDAQGGTNINTRLEAFLYQATQYHRRARGAAPVSA